MLSEAAAQWMLRREVELILDTLSPRERRVLEERFGLAGGQQPIVEDVEHAGVTRELRKAHGLD